MKGATSLSRLWAFLLCNCCLHSVQHTIVCTQSSLPLFWGLDYQSGSYQGTTCHYSDWALWVRIEHCGFELSSQLIKSIIVGRDLKVPTRIDGEKYQHLCHSFWGIEQQLFHSIELSGRMNDNMCHKNWSEEWMTTGEQSKGSHSNPFLCTPAS